jgi:hypothetical protein
MPIWNWHHKVNGKTAYKNIGPLNDLEMEQARKQVTSLKA